MADSVILIGDFDTLVTFQVPLRSNGTRGEVTMTYSDREPIWAKVERGIDEAVNNDNLEQTKNYQVTVYKSEVEGLNTRWRVKIGQDIFEIRGVEPMDRMSLFCTMEVYSIADESWVIGENLPIILD